MVLGHFYHKIYFYSFDNGDMIFFIFSFLKSCCSGLEILQPFSHYDAFSSVFHTIARLRCFKLLVVSVVVSHRSV